MVSNAGTRMMTKLMSNVGTQIEPVHATSP